MVWSRGAVVTNNKKSGSSLRRQAGQVVGCTPAGRYGRCSTADATGGLAAAAMLAASSFAQQA
jgi:hypothetical protein